MKYLILLFLLATPQLGHSLINWPGGPAPCDTTLNACVAGSPDYETIQINTNDEINETIAVFKPVSLVAGNGYRPVFGSGHHIEMTNVATTNRTVRIEGLTFINGRIAYNHQGGSSAGGSLIVRNNVVLSNSSANQNIRILNFSSQTLDLSIDYNQLHYTANQFTTAINGAITIQTGSPTGSQTGTIEGQVYGNTISSTGQDSVGVGVYGFAGTDINLNVAGNELTGGHDGGIYVTRSDSSTGDTAINIGNNAFYAYSEDENFKGVYIEGLAGSISANIINNTAIGAFDAFRFDEIGSAVVVASLYNNIMAFGDAGVVIGANPSLTNDYNLSYMNNFNSAAFTPGPNYMTSNPMIMGKQNARLRPGSPAIEAGNSLQLLLLGATPFVDADGTNRIKKGNNLAGAQQVDIGAYETGDLHFTHEVNSPVNHISEFNHPELTGNSALDNLHVSANWNPPGSAGIYNNDNEGVYYNGSQWTVFNQAITTFNDGAAFNVHGFANTSSTFEHSATEVSSNNTILDNLSLNNQRNRILQVTQNWRGTYNPHPITVFYFNDRWLIANTDLNDIPVGSNFNVYSQAPSKSAWVHVATSANIVSNYTLIDHPLINGVDCAEIQVTQSAENGVFNDAPTGVFYAVASQRWGIFNQDLSVMSNNATFHLTVNPEQIAACTDLIFKDSF